MFLVKSAFCSAQHHGIQPAGVDGTHLDAAHTGDARVLIRTTGTLAGMACAGQSAAQIPQPVQLRPAFGFMGTPPNSL